MTLIMQIEYLDFISVELNKNNMSYVFIWLLVCFKFFSINVCSIELHCKSTTVNIVKMKFLLNVTIDAVFVKLHGYMS